MNYFAGDEDRKLRENRDDDAAEIARNESRRACEGRSVLGIVVEEGAMPAGPNAVYAFREVSILHAEATGGTATITDEGGAAGYAYNIGGRTPDADPETYIVFTHVANGWIFNY